MTGRSGRLRAGARVRLATWKAPDGSVRDRDVDTHGTAVRVDARGVLVELDSGSRILCPPSVVDVVLALVPDGA